MRAQLMPEMRCADLEDESLFKPGGMVVAERTRKKCANLKLQPTFEAPYSFEKAFANHAYKLKHQGTVNAVVMKLFTACPNAQV